MMFIELNMQEGGNTFVNMEFVAEIRPLGKGSILYFNLTIGDDDVDKLQVKESPEEIMQFIDIASHTI